MLIRDRIYLQAVYLYSLPAIDFQGDLIMEENKLKLAQQEVDEALQTVEFMEKVLDESNSKELLKEKFMTLSTKVQELEEILKNEGII